jgi:hypothetical protein
MRDGPGRGGQADRRPDTPVVRFLSNGRFTTLITESGASFSTSSGCALNWWSGDTLEDGDGYIVYIRDISSGAYWSAGRHPALRTPRTYRTSWRPGRYRIRRVDDEVEVSTDVCVAPDADVEVRRLTIRNLADRPCWIELTTHAEVVLQERAAFAAHPAFAKLFIRTAYDRSTGALLAERRPRAPDDIHPWMFHAMIGAADPSFETDRVRFVGRGRDLSAPAALVSTSPLSGKAGSVLDPVLCLRSVVSLDAGEEADRVLLLGAADSRDEALAIVRSLKDEKEMNSTFARARAQATGALHYHALTEEQAEYYQQLGGSILYGRTGSGATAEASPRVTGDLSALRSLGFDPRRPTVVLHAENRSGARVLPDLVRGHRYWRSIALPIDLTIITDDPESVRRGISSPGGEEARVLRRADLSAPMIDLIDVAASLVVSDGLPEFPTVRFQSGDSETAASDEGAERGGLE